MVGSSTGISSRPLPIVVVVEAEAAPCIEADVDMPCIDEADGEPTSANSLATRRSMSGEELAGDGVSRSSTIGAWLAAEGCCEIVGSAFASLPLALEDAEEDVEEEDEEAAVGEVPTTFKNAALPTRCRSFDQSDSNRTLSFSIFFRFSSCQIGKGNQGRNRL